MCSIFEPFLCWVHSDISKYCTNMFGLGTIHAVLLLHDLHPKLGVHCMVGFSFSVIPLSV
jgi:hypothetical protein